MLLIEEKKNVFPAVPGVLSTQNVATGGAESAESAIGFSLSIILHLDHSLDWHSTPT